MTGPSSINSTSRDTRVSVSSADVEGGHGQREPRPSRSSPRTSNTFAGMPSPRSGQISGTAGRSGSSSIELAEIERAERGIDPAELDSTIRQITEQIPATIPSNATEVSLWKHATGNLQTVLSGAVTAGTTFGVFRGLG